MPLIIALASARYFIEPTKALWQAILHLSPSEHGVAAPKPEKLRVGRELVTNLTGQLYQLVTESEHPNQSSASDEANFMLRNLPLPYFVIDSDDNVVSCNELAASYIGKELHEVVGNNFYSVFDMSFPSENTFDKWLGEVRGNKATATNYWERVRVSVSEKATNHYFDLAAYYNQGNQSGLETMLVLFDHTEEYSQDDQAVSFIALAVHELRTPITLLRGYIEVFEEEVGKDLSPELQDFMNKLKANAENLTAFINNILNVARVDDDQLVLQLTEANPAEVIQGAIDTMTLRAKVRDISLEYTAEKDLPTVGVDRVSIQEVLVNLLDNAVKYSKDSKKVIIKTFINKDNLVETSVQDKGVGIPTNLVPHLFSKFYRDHRNRAQIGGTGLGLYLSKAIVTAHGGNIWVRSKENEGSTFSFTLVPYTQLNNEHKLSDDQTITHNAHGWIKNHSLYRN